MSYSSVAPFASASLAPKVDSEAPHKHLVPKKKSKLGLLVGNKTKEKASKDFSNMLVAGAPPSEEEGSKSTSIILRTLNSNKQNKENRDKPQGHSKTPEPFKPADERARLNSLDSGILLTMPTPQEPLELKVCAMHSVRSLACMASWAQLSGEKEKEQVKAIPIPTISRPKVKVKIRVKKKEKDKDKENGNSKKKKKKQKTEQGRDKEAHNKTVRSSGSSSEAGTLSP
ncbi:hypothetical protein OBBRIDRAFT_868079 [Obba rivulosa]|uniref:Uncharacterized protein n=1 Tax=Obba rivulosa TaxID=1052685 RepID=A0A8E2AL91_9APHY|nr:hypothetical protein OBBRIDRAFT_868079 [Obba rivulosa]